MKLSQAIKPISYFKAHAAVVIVHGIIDGRRNLRETMRQRILI